MKITIAKTAGFCMGVRRAVEMALEAPGKYTGAIHTYGPLIHNPQVLQLFQEKGITVIDALPDSGEGTILIRAHGVPPEVKQCLAEIGFKVIDATCPRVIRVQTIIRVHARKGYAVIILGDRDHPEVVGLQGFAGDQGHVVANLDEIKALPDFDQAILVAQTTQNTAHYEKIKVWLGEHRPDYKLFDTICGSTERRQAEVKRLAGIVDAVVVVGGKKSGNTQRLTEIARQEGNPTYHVETEADLDLDAMAGIERIGITAGASTPNWIIKRVYRAIEKLPLMQKRWGWSKALWLQQNLLLTNFYVALGAGCLCFACINLEGSGRFFPAVPVAVLYVLSMHILNHLTGRAGDRFNDPDRAQFYRKNRIFLTVTALVAGAAGLVAAFSMGILPFVILLGMSVTGLSYNLELIPKAKGKSGRIRRVRDIPGSKTILITAAWGVVTALLPALTTAGEVTIGTALVFIWACSIVFVRTAFFDLLDMQGDRIVGKETIPILLGEKRSQRLLKNVALFSGLITLAGSALGWMTGLGYLLATAPLMLLMLFAAYQHGRMLPGIRLEFFVESLFVATGLLTLIWKMGGL